MTTNGQLPVVTETPDADDAIQVDAVMQGLKHYHGMRNDNTRLKKDIEECKAYIAKLEAANEEANQQLNKSREELEHFRLMAVEAKTHLGILLGHTTHAYDRVKAIES